MRKSRMKSRMHSKREGFLGSQILPLNFQGLSTKSSKATNGLQVYTCNFPGLDIYPQFSYRYTKIYETLLVPSAASKKDFISIQTQMKVSSLIFPLCIQTF